MTRHNFNFLFDGIYFKVDARLESRSSIKYIHSKPLKVIWLLLSFVLSLKKNERDWNSTAGDCFVSIRIYGMEVNENECTASDNIEYVIQCMIEELIFLSFSSTPLTISIISSSWFSTLDSWQSKMITLTRHLLLLHCLASVPHVMPSAECAMCNERTCFLHIK